MKLLKMAAAWSLALSCLVGSPAAAQTGAPLTPSSTARELAGAVIAAPDLLVAKAYAGQVLGPQVNSASGLVATLKTAQGGDRVRLAPGPYGGVSLAGFTFSPPVTLEAAGAVFTALKLDRVDGLVMEGGTVALDPASSASSASVTDSANVAIRGLEVYGKAVSGLTITRGTKVEVSGGYFHDLRNAVLITAGENVLVTKNKVRRMLSDGMVGSGGPRNLTISYNDMSDFSPQAGAHPDGVQLFTRNATRSAEDIKIIGNRITRGSGGIPQGIFVTTQAGWVLPYRRVEISGNYIEGAMHYGIGLQNADVVEIKGNIVQPIEGQKSRIHLINLSNAVVSGNSAWMITQQGPVVTVTGTRALGFLKPVAP
jgi:hypothetical protein